MRVRSRSISVYGDLRGHLNVSVTLDFGNGITKSIPISCGPKAISKIVLRTIDPNACRAAPSVREAIRRICDLVVSERDLAMKKALRLGWKRFQPKIDSLAKHRIAREKRDRYYDGVATIRSVLSDSCEDMPLEELITIWNEAKVGRVMAS